MIVALRLPVTKFNGCGNAFSDDDIYMGSSGFTESAPALVVSMKTPTHSTEPPVDSDAMERLLTDKESFSEEPNSSDSLVFSPRENAEASVGKVFPASGKFPYCSRVLETSVSIFSIKTCFPEVSVPEPAPSTSSSVTMPPKKSDGPSTSKEPDEPKRVSKLPLIIPHKVVRKPRTSRSGSKSAARTPMEKASKPGTRIIFL